MHKTSHALKRNKMCTRKLSGHRSSLQVVYKILKGDLTFYVFQPSLETHRFVTMLKFFDEVH